MIKKVALGLTLSLITIPFLLGGVGKRSDISDKENLVVISGPGSMKAAQEIIDKKGKELNVLINSPGGSVIGGHILVSAMEMAKARGMKVNCTVGVVAASMAMNLLAYCDERRALPNSLLLFHEAYMLIGGGMFVPPTKLTSRDTRRMSRDSDILSKEFEDRLIKELDTDPETFREHNESETLWPAHVFASRFPGFKLVLVDDIQLPEGIKLFNIEE
jgi:hypothetical protein